MGENFVKHASARIMEHVTQINAFVHPIFMEIYAKKNYVKMEASLISWETANALTYLVENSVNNANVKMLELVMEKNAHAPIIMKENYAKI
jgi:hypothetical protein